ncbi:MAG: insulinase family protein [Burkholderiales bacterium]|nr:insulinase family protein [Burkholderiales bacterium]
MTTMSLRFSLAACALALTLAWAPARADGPAPAAPAAAPAATIPARLDPSAVPPRVKAPNDASAYRRFVLPNGMKVILLSDPKLNKASAAVAVGVGSLADPPERPGLAHYLEHMLFLGTEKYPEVDEFSQYLQRNNGSTNAYTARDRTNYHLEVRPEAFEGALDRFAQFFIAPRFDPDFSEREVNAVHSEFQMNLEDDGWREFALRNLAYREGHPARGFNIGSRESLAGTTRDELLAFHRRYYSADRMTLALAAPASPDELERWARAHFAAVPDLDRPELRYEADYLPPKPALRMLRMEPIKDLRRLTLSFPMPDLRAHAGSKPAELVGLVLGHEGPGSLLAALKAEGLATTLSAGAWQDTPDYGSFDLEIGLTPEGLARHQEVMQRVFAAIALLGSQALPAHVFDERRTMAALDERYGDRGEGAGRAANLANAIMDYPLEVAERVPYLWLQPDAAAVKIVLDRLRPDNMLAMLIARGLPTDRSAPHFGTRYSYVEETGDAYAALFAPPPVAALALPAPNRFVPATTALRPVAATRLIDQPALSLVHLQDTGFERPQVAHLARFVLPRQRATLRDAVRLMFYAACIDEALTETRYVAAEAGLRFRLSASLEGVSFGVEGYDASAARLLDEVAPGLRDCPIEPARFDAIKDRLLRGLAAFERVDAYQTLTESRRRIVREAYFRPDEMLPVARAVTLAELRDFARGLYARGKLEMLAHGNVGADEAVAVARRVAAALAPAPLPEAKLLRRRLLAMAPGEAIVASEALAVNNSAYRRELLLGTDTPELRAFSEVLAAFVGPATYTELRTRQQLGYIVWGGAGNEDRTQFAYFIVQSGDHPADVLAARTDAFVATLPAQFAALTEDDWQTIKAGVRARLLEKDKSIAERAARLFALAYERDADWGRDDATLAALDALTRERAAALLAEALAPATQRSRSFLGFAREHAPAQPVATSFDDARKWKATRRYE